MKTDGNGRKNHISTSVSIFVGGNGIGFGKYGFGNGIKICGCTETNQYDWKFNGKRVEAKNLSRNTAHLYTHNHTHLWQ
jgi:hypothetical protein